MADRGLLLSPADNGDVVELSQLVYRKRILPLATINYRGRQIRFDRQYLTDLAQSFQDNAYDQVAFMLADANNTHTLDPERFRGEVQGVEVGDDGLYATLRVTPEGAKALRENPKLGVSARILENYERSDGRQFPRALQHVLGTLDPVIPGLGSWEEVALSNGVLPENVTDLSETSYEELEPMATRAENLKQVAEATGLTAEQITALEMTDDELAIYASAFTSDETVDDSETAEAIATAVEDDELVEEPGEETNLFEEDATDDAPLPTQEEIEAAVEALTDDELDELAAELERTDDEAVAEMEPVEVAEETPAEPTDTELVERLADGRWESGIRETPAENDPDLADLTDEALAEMWNTLAATDEAAAANGGVDIEPFTEDDRAPADADAEDEAEPAEDVTPDVPRELAAAGAVALSNAAAPEVTVLSQQVSVLQRELAEQKFVAMRTDYVRKGVPAALVDLARPVLVAGGNAVLEFSNTAGQPQTVDAAEIVKQLLDSATGYIDLARERGHAYPMTSDDLAASEADEDKRLAHMWGEAYS